MNYILIIIVGFAIPLTSKIMDNRSTISRNESVARNVYEKRKRRRRRRRLTFKRTNLIDKFMVTVFFCISTLGFFREFDMANLDTFVAYTCLYDRGTAEQIADR